MPDIDNDSAANLAEVWPSSVEKLDPPTKLNLARKREDWVKNPKSVGAGALSQTVIHFRLLINWPIIPAKSA